MFRLFRYEKTDLQKDYKKIVKEKLNSLTSKKLNDIFKSVAVHASFPSEINRNPGSDFKEHIIFTMASAKFMVGLPYYIGKSIYAAYQFPEVKENASTKEIKCILADRFLHAGEIEENSLDYFILNHLFRVNSWDPDLSKPLANEYKELLLEECGYKRIIEADQSKKIEEMNPASLTNRDEIEARYGMDIFSDDELDIKDKLRFA